MASVFVEPRQSGAPRETISMTTSLKTTPIISCAHRRPRKRGKRPKMMEAWAEFCEEKTSSKVVQIRKWMSS